MMKNRRDGQAEGDSQESRRASQQPLSRAPLSEDPKHLTEAGLQVLMEACQSGRTEGCILDLFILIYLFRYLALEIICSLSTGPVPVKGRPFSGRNGLSKTQKDKEK